MEHSAFYEGTVDECNLQYVGLQKMRIGRAIRVVDSVVWLLQVFAYYCIYLFQLSSGEGKTSKKLRRNTC